MLLYLPLKSAYKCPISAYKCLIFGRPLRLFKNKLSVQNGRDVTMFVMDVKGKQKPYVASVAIHSDNVTNGSNAAHVFASAT